MEWTRAAKIAKISSGSRPPPPTAPPSILLSQPLRPRTRSSAPISSPTLPTSSLPSLRSLRRVRRAHEVYSISAMSTRFSTRLQCLRPASGPPEPGILRFAENCGMIYRRPTEPVTWNTETLPAMGTSMKNIHWSHQLCAFLGRRGNSDVIEAGRPNDHVGSSD